MKFDREFVSKRVSLLSLHYARAACEMRRAVVLCLCVVDIATCVFGSGRDSLMIYTPKNTVFIIIILSSAGHASRTILRKSIRVGYSTLRECTLFVEKCIEPLMASNT